MTGDTKPVVQVPPKWQPTHDGTRMARSITAKDFAEVLDIVNQIGQAAERLEHHPDLHIESWNHLRIETYSHDVGRLTTRDAALANAVDEILAHGGY